LIPSFPQLNEKEKKIFEHLLYLTLLLAVLERDRINAEKIPFKLKIAYINLLEHTMKKVQADLKGFTYKMKKNKMKILKGVQNREFAEYYFYIHDCEYLFRYSSTELKSNTEKLLCYYFFKETDLFN